MPTLSELAGFGAGTSPLGLLSGAVDERTRYYANIVRGLLDNPAALVDQLRAQNAENVRDRARSAQDTRSVMPQIADPAKQAAFDEAMNIGLLGMTVSKPSYQGQHAAPIRDSGAPLHNLSSVYPDDLYSAMGSRYYGHYGDARDMTAVGTIHNYRNKPNASITIYRAVPSGPAEKAAKLEKQMREYMRRGKIPDGDQPSMWYDRAIEKLEKLKNEAASDYASINPGDWVTISRQYAKEHGEGALNGDYKIISKKVKAKDIYTNGDSIFEWGYDPS